MSFVFEIFNYFYFIFIFKFFILLFFIYFNFICTYFYFNFYWFLILIFVLFIYFFIIFQFLFYFYSFLNFFFRGGFFWYLCTYVSAAPVTDNQRLDPSFALSDANTQNQSVFLSPGVSKLNVRQQVGNTVENTCAPRKGFLKAQKTCLLIISWAACSFLGQN